MTAGQCSGKCSRQERVQAKVQRLKTGPIQLREHTPTEKQQVQRHQGGSPTTRLTLRQAGNLSSGQQNTHKILQRKKQTNTQYDNAARFDGQRFGKLKTATWNVRRITKKMEELQTQLLKRKTDIAIIIETKKKNKGSEDTGNYVMIYSGVPANQWTSS